MKTPLQLRAEKLFRRRPTTPWDRSEQKAWEIAEAIAQDLTELDWTALELYYAEPKENTYARRSFSVLLNNLNGEVSKAIEWCGVNGRLADTKPTIKIGKFTYDEQTPPSIDQLRVIGQDQEFGFYMDEYRKWKATLP